MSDQTNLSDLLSLNLHEFEDEVRTIVDKATKELSMEKTLKEFAVTWAQMEFDHERHQRTGIVQISASEEVIEALEDNQVIITSLVKPGGCYVTIVF
jgi:dynein heavy chain